MTSRTSSSLTQKGKNAATTQCTELLLSFCTKKITARSKRTRRHTAMSTYRHGAGLCRFLAASSFATTKVPSHKGTSERQTDELSLASERLKIPSSIQNREASLTMTPRTPSSLLTLCLQLAHIDIPLKGRLYQVLPRLENVGRPSEQNAND